MQNGSTALEPFVQSPGIAWTRSPPPRSPHHKESYALPDSSHPDPAAYPHALLTRPALAQGSTPQVQPISAVQPIAPGYQKLPPLPQLRLTPALREVKSVEYLANGFLEAAHALVLLGRRCSR